MSHVCERPELGLQWQKHLLLIEMLKSIDFRKALLLPLGLQSYDDRFDTLIKLGLHNHAHSLYMATGLMCCKAAPVVCKDPNLSEASIISFAVVLRCLWICV